jgi:hypothetical protein
MTESARLVAVGISNGTTIEANVMPGAFSSVVAVVLTADYAMLAPDGPFITGFPFRPSFMGTSTPQFPHTIPSGSTLSLYACEAAPLLAAGGAVLA